MSILTNLVSVCLVPVLFFCFALSDDQNCMNGATKIIPVGVSSDNPNKVMTYVRDDPGYVTNLKCKWELRAEDYNKPRQMLLNVTLVDFDTNDATKEKCSESQVDFFNFTFSGQLSPRRQVSSERWCSNNDIKPASRLILANLWNSSNFLTVEFKSDDKQVRTNAKGVEMDVLIMAEDYCHRSMLYHNSACYLVTAEKFNFSEALETAKRLMGNLVTFPTDADVKSFLDANTNRVGVFPFKAPFDFAGQKVWTGNFMSGNPRVNKYMNRCDKCNPADAKDIKPPEDCTREPNNVYGVAMEVKSGNEPRFSCLTLDTKLPALIEFTQIGANRCSPFDTCDKLPIPEPIPEPIPIVTIIAIVVAILLLLAFVIAVVIFVWRRNGRESAEAGDASEPMTTKQGDAGVKKSLNKENQNYVA